jgi:hypothetical protein
MSGDMSKPSKRSKQSRGTVDLSATTDVVTQLECAIRRPQATLIGALVGGLVPWFARTLAHEEVPSAWSAGNRSLAMVMIAVVLGCACFSAITVYKFGRATFGDKRKALGFVLAIEGVMLVSSGVTSAVALAVLIAINALANGSAIALARDATCRKRDAAARAATTRKSSRASKTSTVPAHSAPINAPIEVVEGTVPRPRARRAGVKVPRWNPTAMDDVIDAEIVSEQKLLA